MQVRFKCECSWTGTTPVYVPKAPLEACLRCPECAEPVRITPGFQRDMLAEIRREML